MANYKLILKNTTGTAIELDEGIIIPASGQVTIDPTQRRKFWDDIDVIGNLSTQIRNGDIVINDGVRDITITNDIDVERAVDYIKFPDRAFNLRFETEPERSNGYPTNVRNVQEAIEYSRNSGVGTIVDFHFSDGNANTNNKWLAFGDPSAPTDQVPLIAPQLMEVKGVTFSNNDDDSSTDIEVYINAIYSFTVEVRNKRYFWDVGATKAIINQGDRISVFLRKAGSVNDQPSKPQISLYCRIVSEVAAIDGEQFGD